MKSIDKASDLVTTKEHTISGFSWQADQKLSRAAVFAHNADYFTSNLSNIRCVDDLRKDRKLLDFAIAACMLSKKSLNHLNLETQNELLLKLIDFRKLSDPSYVIELQRRYFLTCGDSLGGTMRNAVGQYAQEFLTKALLNRLDAVGIEPIIYLNNSDKVVSIHWDNRRIIFDKKPKFINKSVDILVVSGTSAITGNLEDPKDYVCCGELKGGIDPAGADEHWKTAKTALERIHTAFSVHLDKVPKLVFIGAAIEKEMASEIFQLLQSNWLDGAANINNPDQFSEVVDIILGLS